MVEMTGPESREANRNADSAITQATSLPPLDTIRPTEQIQHARHASPTVHSSPEPDRWSRWSLDTDVAAKTGSVDRSSRRLSRLSTERDAVNTDWIYQEALEKGHNDQDLGPGTPLLEQQSNSDQYHPSQSRYRRRRCFFSTTRRHPLCRANEALWLCVMLGTAISIFVLLYAWTIQSLWEREAMRRERGVWDLDGGFGASNASNSIPRRWIHSHNDEMHGKDALTLAMSVGCGSIEVDVWLGPGGKSVSAGVDDSSSSGMTLLTGHKIEDVSHQTLKHLYLDPILKTLDENNADRASNTSLIGLYKDDPDAEVQLVIDFKSDGATMWPYVVSALQSLLHRGYLTQYHTTNSTWTRGPITIIGTGDTPLEGVYHQSPRFIFYDAPIKALRAPVTIPSSAFGPKATFSWDSTVAPMASGKLPPLYHLALALPPWSSMVDRLRGYSNQARDLGMSSRWWGYAHKPTWIRRRMWEVIRESGAVWVNADELVEAADWLDAWGRG